MSLKKYTLKHRNRLLLCLIFALSSLMILMFNSRSSFLYPDNGWVDAQAFYTVGRGWMHGLIPYRDLFEQKGPLLYLLYGLGSLIDPHGFGGIFLFEWISLTISAYWISRCCSLLIREKLSVFVTVASLILLTSNASFEHGGSAEEFLFPAFFYSLYSFMAFFRGKEMGWKTLLANGLMAGLVLVTKFNLLGFWFAWMMLVFFRLCFQKKWMEGIRACFIFLGGMILPLAGFVLYFLFAGALPEFIDGYFLFNMGSYTDASEKLSLAMRGRYIWNAVYTSFMDRSRMSLFLLAGLAWLLLCHPLLGICILVLFVFTCLGVYFSGTYYYYYYLFPSLFSIFACMGVFWAIDWLLRKIRIMPEAVRQVIYTGLLIAAFGWGLYESPNAFSETFMMPEEDRWYSQMIDYMDQYQCH